MNDVVRAKNYAKNMAQNDRTTTLLGNIPELEFRKDFRKGKKKRKGRIIDDIDESNF